MESEIITVLSKKHPQSRDDVYLQIPNIDHKNFNIRKLFNYHVDNLIEAGILTEVYENILDLKNGD